MPLCYLTSSGLGSDFSAGDVVLLGQIAPAFKLQIGEISVILCVASNDG